jgi:hypothetical protein
MVAVWGGFWRHESGSEARRRSSTGLAVLGTLLAGDFPAFLGLHTEDVVMHVPGNGPLSGDHYGRDGIAAVFQQEIGMLDAPPEVIPLDNLGSDDHACGLVIQRMQRGSLVRGPAGSHRPGQRRPACRGLVPARGSTASDYFFA